MTSEYWDIIQPDFKSINYKNFYTELLTYTNKALKVIHEKNGHQPPFVVTNYLNDRTLNAKVKYVEVNSYQLGINIALPALIHFYFNNILRTSNYLSHLGSLDGDYIHSFYKSGIPTSLPENIEILEAIPMITGSSRPIDDARAAAAVALTKIAVSFCIYHEIAHIELGHIKTFQSDFDQIEFVEFTSINQYIKNYKVRQVWEYEADKTAAIIVISDMVESQNFNDLTTQFELSQESIDDLIGIVVSSIYSLFHQITYKTKWWKFNNTHPKPLTRIIAIIEEVILYVEENYPNRISNSRDFQETVWSAFYSTHYAWKEMKLYKLQNLNKQKIWRKAYQELSKLETNRKLFNKLYKHNSYDYPFYE